MGQSGDSRFLIESRIAGDGSIWMLVTNQGGNDPDGKGGCIIVALGGSGCRWVQYDPADRDGSFTRFQRAQAFHRGEHVGQSGCSCLSCDCRLYHDLKMERNRYRAAIEAVLHSDLALTEHDPEWRACRDAVMNDLRRALDA